MFFSVAPKQALLGDLNTELIEVYRQVRRNAANIEDALQNLPVNRRFYKRIRAQIPKTAFERAVRFVYLNRTCYGGLHRTNRHGFFNVPYGGGDRTPEPVYRDQLLRQAARVLRKSKVEFQVCDFAQLLGQAMAGDVVFCDPTYRSVGRGRFDRYGPIVFSWEDQQRLATLAIQAQDRGAVVLIMNADDPDVLSLYDRSRVFRLEKTKAIGNKSKDHAKDREIMTILDPLDRQIWLGVSDKPVPWTSVVDNKRRHLHTHTSVIPEIIS